MQIVLVFQKQRNQRLTFTQPACCQKKKGGEEHFKPGETTSWMSWIDWSLPSQLPEELVALAGVKERE